MDKLKMHSVNKVDENITKISALFPNALTEVIKGYRKDGSAIIEHAIDFEVLRQELSNVVVDAPEERYQFTWPDKKRSILLANAPITKTLRPCRTESVDFDSTKNLYIEGDNLDALKLLQETYLGKVKMIYIDPPYNTGNDFVYEDDFVQSTDEYLTKCGQYDEEGNRLVQNPETNGRFHTDWLNMIYPRLRLAKDLLTQDGVIFISINDIELTNLTKVCDEVFGADGHIATFVWKNKYGPGALTRGVASLHEYIVCYGRTYPDSIEATLSDSEKEKYKMRDEKFEVRGGYITQPLATKSKDDRPNLVYPILHNGIEIWPDKQWIWSKERLYTAHKNEEIVINENKGKYSVRFKQYLRNEKGELRKGKPLSLIMSPFNQDGTKELEILLGRGVFDFPKPSELIKGLLSLTINGDETKDFIILDFFSGSSTTAHAVMQLNAQDGGNRKFIMVQMPEKTAEKSEAFKKGYKNICEIGKERIRLAGKKIVEQRSEVSDKLDIGFRVLKVDSTNMQDVYYSPAEYSQQMLIDLKDNIKPDRTPEDLLFQVMLDLGVLLSSKIEEISIGGKKVFNVADGYLMACFDSNVTREVITEIAKQQPYYAVFRDSGMASDSVATNFEQIFGTYSPTTVRKVL